jgi:hypothetical protein
MSVPSLDSLDRFLELHERVQSKNASEDEKLEWRNLVRALLEGEVGARSRKNPTEGRRHVRTSVRLLARVQGSKGPSATVNVSLGTGGFRVHAALPYERGAVLELSIPLPDAPEPVRALTRVAWRRPGSVGLELIELAQSDRDLLESAVVEAMLRSR